MPIPLSRSSSSDSSKMSSLGFSNLRSVNWGNWEHWVEGGGNKRLRVEGGSNSVIDGSNGQTRVSNPESCSVSNVLNLLELSIGINIRVSTGDSSVSVSNLLLDRVDVGVTIVQVAKLILSVELAASSVGSSSNDWGSSSIGHSWGSNWSSSISISWGSSIRHSWGGSNNWSWGSNWSSSIRISSITSNSIWQTSMAIGTSIAKTSMAIGTSIAKTSIRIASISQRGGQDLCFLSKTNGHEGGDDGSQLHGVHCCVMLNGPM